MEIDREEKNLDRELWNYSTIQPAFTCSKLTKQTREQGVKYVQS